MVFHSFRLLIFLYLGSFTVSNPVQGILALYNSWEAFNPQSIFVNWTPADPSTVCAWAGVTCDDESSIVEVSLHAKDIVGTLPTQIGLLADVKKLHLQKNKLTSTVPVELSGLSALSDLRLQSNKLTGALPSQLASLRNLSSIKLFSNSLCGEFPDFLDSVAVVQTPGNYFGIECCAAYGSLSQNGTYHESCAPSPVPTDIQECSVKSCSDLGWARTSGRNHLCAESDGEDLGGCSYTVRWTNAREFCQEAGARLCTASELANDRAGAGSGCSGSNNPDLDHKFVWSSSFCEEETGNKYVVVKVGAEGMASESRCAEASTHGTYYGRCCADESCTFSPTITSTPTYVPTVSHPPTLSPSSLPSSPFPSPHPSIAPTISSQPSGTPSLSPSNFPTIAPTLSFQPSIAPSTTRSPTVAPTLLPSTSFPSISPSNVPSLTRAPTQPPSQLPTDNPTQFPSHNPTMLAETQTGSRRWSALLDGGGTSIYGVQTAMEAAAEPLNLWLFNREDCVNGNDFANTGGSIGQADDALPAYLKESSLGALRRSNSTLDGEDGQIACLDGHGVRVRKNLPSSSGVVLESVETISGLSRQKDESANTSLKGLSIEIWGDFSATDKLSIDTDVVRPLVSLGGQNNAQGGSPFSDVCDSDPWFDVGIWLRQKPKQQLQLTVPDHTDGPTDDSCLRLPPDGRAGLPYLSLRNETLASTSSSSPLSPSISRHHIVATFNNSAAAIYLDGDLKRTDPNFFGDIPLQERWKFFNSLNRLQLLSAASVLNVAPFPATLYLVAVWGIALPLEAIHQNYRAGLPNSPPLARDLNVTINEDGEYPRCGGIGGQNYDSHSAISHSSSYDLSPSAGSKGIEAFRQPLEPISALATIELQVVDQDNDPAFTPNYRSDLAHSHPTRCVITQLPERGTIYLSTGTLDAVLESGTEIHPNKNGTFIVHYRPPKDQYSTMASTVFDDDSSHTIRHNEYEPFITFQYRALDGVTGVASTNPGIVTVYVFPCNDPPIARNTSNIALSKSITPVPINASDVDNPTDAVSAFIMAPPVAAGGNLLWWHEDSYYNVTHYPFRVNLKPRNDIENVDESLCYADDYDETFDFSSLPGFYGCFAYIYEGIESLPLRDKFGTLLLDRFEYVVQDIHGANSTPAMIEMTVRLPLLARSSAEDGTKHTVPEATLANVTIGTAKDQSNERRPVAVRITRLPFGGEIFDPAVSESAYGIPLTNGSRLSTPSIWPYLDPIVVLYRGKDFFFTSPGVRYDGTPLFFNVSTFDDEVLSSTGEAADSFSFATELWDNPSVQSASVDQPVVVVNVNNPAVLVKPMSDSFSVLAVGTSTNANNEGSSDRNRQSSGDSDNEEDDFFNDFLVGCSESNTSPGSTPCPSQQPTLQPSIYAVGDDIQESEDELILTEISIQDRDRDVDPIKVRVACKYGFLTLRRSILDALDFSSFDVCYGHEDWSCRGDGTADRDLIFVGQPSDVSQALNRLTYQSTYSFTTDILTIHIADGSRSPITGFSNGYDIETEVDSILDCLDGVDFITESFRGIESPICFRSALNLTIKVGRVAGSEDVVAEEDISKNRQLSIAGIVFGLMICLCILRVFASKICGWKLVAIPSEWSDDDDTDDTNSSSGESESDSDQDIDVHSPFHNSGGSGEEKLPVLRRGALKGLDLTWLRRNNELSKAAEEVNTSLLMPLSRRPKNNLRDIELQQLEPTTSAMSATMGSTHENEKREVQNSGMGSGRSKRKAIRHSIAQATMLKVQGVGPRQGDGQSLSSEYRFDPAEWKKHQDSDGHWFFTHLESGVKSYAMPWVLRGVDRHDRLHEANEPRNWRCIDTGHVHDDGRPIALYANRVTKQSTFDAPLFASWSSDTAAEVEH